jgi:hypothetical protein
MGSFCNYKSLTSKSKTIKSIFVQFGTITMIMGFILSQCPHFGNDIKIWTTWSKLKGHKQKWDILGAHQILGVKVENSY